MFLTLKQLCKAQWFCLRVCSKGDMNIWGWCENWENWKEPTTSTDVSFNCYSAEETLNVHKAYGE